MAGLIQKILRSSWLGVLLAALAGLLWWAAPASDSGHGLLASYYPNPDWQGPPAHTAVIRRINLSMDGNIASSAEINYSIRMEGFILLPRSGRFTFWLESDDGSSLAIDDRPVVENGGLHGRRAAEGSADLLAGEHRLVIKYSQALGESYLKARVRGPGEEAFFDLPLSWLAPVPLAQFDQAQAFGQARSRAFLLALCTLLLFLAAGHLIWLRRSWWSRFFSQPDFRKAATLRLVGNPWVHDGVCLLLCLGFYVQITADRIGSESYMKGDSPYYANVAISLWRDGDLDQINQTDRRIFERPETWSMVPLGVSNIAVGARGEWYPKHPFLMPLLSVPFYATFGGIGFVVYNIVSLLLLVLAMRRLALCFTGPAGASAVAVLVGLCPMFYVFAYSYCTDILAALFLVAGFEALIKRRGVWCGVWLGLAAWVKLPNLFMIPMAGVFLLLVRDWRASARFGLGCLASLGAFGGFNWYMFGAPWITSYQRVWVIEHGVSKVGDHLGNFNVPFWEGFRFQLVDSVHGLFSTASVALIALLGYVWLYKKSKGAALLVFLFSAANFIFYCKYDFTSSSHYSNRFLMPVVALCAAPLACLADRLFAPKKST